MTKRELVVLVVRLHTSTANTIIYLERSYSYRSLVVRGLMELCQ